MQWIVYTQFAILLLLVCPGVLSIGTAYAMLSQLYVFVAVTLDDTELIKNAARMNTGVALGNIVLQFLVWRSTSNILNSSGAAFRTAVFTVAGIAMITTSEFLLRLQKAKAVVAPGMADTQVAHKKPAATTVNTTNTAPETPETPSAFNTNLHSTIRQRKIA